jgi:hypothetical protein
MKFPSPKKPEAGDQRLLFRIIDLYIRMSWRVLGGLVGSGPCQDSLSRINKDF